MQKQLNIGFIGLGKMGAGMCANIQKAGFTLTVYNRTRSKAERFETKGAAVAQTSREAAERADIVFSSLMDDASVLENCEGENGILAGLKSGGIHVGLTTIQPATSDTLEDRHGEVGCRYIAAPVAGRPDAAEGGSLISFLGGDPDAIEIARPVIDTYSEKVVVVDTPGRASAMKVSVNYMAIAQLVVLGEVFAFAEKSGLNKDLVFMISKFLYGGSGPMVEYAEKIKNRRFENAGFELTGGLKDAKLFETAFLEAGVRPSIATIARENLMVAAMNGLASKDWSALTEVSRKAAGLSSQIM